MTEWDRCRPWIEAALEYDCGTHTADDVLAEIVRGDAILWPGERCCCVTQVCIYPRKRLLSYWLAGGNMKELIGKLLPVIEKFAVEAKFDGIAVPGRPGWARVLARHGYAPAHTVLRKDLT